MQSPDNVAGATLLVWSFIYGMLSTQTSSESAPFIRVSIDWHQLLPASPRASLLPVVSVPNISFLLGQIHGIQPLLGGDCGIFPTYFGQACVLQLPSSNFLCIKPSSVSSHYALLQPIFSSLIVWISQILLDA